jgi:hypothetical protein
MESLENNTEQYELKSFSRKLNPEDHLKDRMIMRHLSRRKNNFLLDLEQPINVQKNFGASNE